MAGREHLQERRRARAMTPSQICFRYRQINTVLLDCRLSKRSPPLRRRKRRRLPRVHPFFSRCTGLAMEKADIWYSSSQFVKNFLTVPSFLASVWPWINHTADGCLSLRESVTWDRVVGIVILDGTQRIGPLFLIECPKTPNYCTTLYPTTALH